MNELKLELIRRILTLKSTSSDLYINGVFECHVLEDTDRKLTSSMPLDEIKRIKVFGETAIPYGTYKVIISKSTRFQKMFPEILEVPGYSGVRIHAGNFPKDTEGCLLVGTTLFKDEIRNSKIALSNLMAKLEKADSISIDIKKEQHDA